MLVKDLMDLGYKGEELKVKLIQRKDSLNNAFNQLLEDRLKEETIPLEEAIRSIENEV